jgi:hypothetical protein
VSRVVPVVPLDASCHLCRHGDTTYATETFHGCAGFDLTGLTREHFDMLCRTNADPSYKLAAVCHAYDPDSKFVSEDGDG